MKEWSTAADDDAAKDDGTALAPIALVLVDDDDVITAGHESLAELVGRPATELLGSRLPDLFHIRIRSLVADGLGSCRQTAQGRALGHFWVDAGDRADLVAEVHIEPGPAPGALTVVLRDGTDAFEDLHRHRAFHESLRIDLEEVATHVTRWNHDHVLEYHSAGFADLTPIDPGELLARPSIDQCRFTESAAHAWHHGLARVFASAGPVDFDWETVDGTWIHARAMPEFGADGFVTHVVVVCYDVSEQRERYEERTSRALVDPLTGLDNRAAALAHVDRALNRRDRTSTSDAIIHLDLDRFTSINDSLGRSVGDELLITVGKRLRSILRPHDVVSRIGGDEFIVFLQQMPGIEQVLLVVERIRGAVGEPLTVRGSEVPVRASVGIAFAPERNASATELLADAKGATEKAKRLGRDRVEMHDELLREQAEQRMKNEIALKRAMRNGEMEVHFLPEFDLETRDPLGAEALIRWHHPERGLVPAAEFIALAEESGLLVTLGNEVLHRSCELVAGWLRTQPLESFNLRVNLSARRAGPGHPGVERCRRLDRYQARPFHAVPGTQRRHPHRRARRDPAGPLPAS